VGESPAEERKKPKSSGRKKEATKQTNLEGLSRKTSAEKKGNASVGRTKRAGEDVRQKRGGGNRVQLIRKQRGLLG